MSVRNRICLSYDKYIRYIHKKQIVFKKYNSDTKTHN